MTIYLSEYQTFESVHELNHHVDQYRQLTTATEFRVLWLLSRYAVKYPGAAHLKAATIAAELDVSTKTIYRALKSLAELGAIIKHVTTRPKSGGQGANIYTIQPCVQAQVSSREPAEKPSVASAQDVKNEEETAPSINLKSINNINTYYGRFKSLIASTLGEVKQSLISRLFGVYKAQSAPLFIGTGFNPEDVEWTGLSALKAAIMATKQKNIRNLPGYYNGVLDRMYDRLYFEGGIAYG